MQATGLFVLAAFVGIIMLVVFGAAWFIAIPVAFLLFLVPVAFLASFAALRTRRTRPSGSAAAPSSEQASYDPVADPGQQPRTRAR